MAAIDPGRVVADLRDLKGLTGDDDGAQRVAWTDTWKTANDWLRNELDAIDGVSVETDAAGNLWATAPGDSERFVIIGGHWTRCPTAGGSMGSSTSSRGSRCCAPRRPSRAR